MKRRREKTLPRPPRCLCSVLCCQLGKLGTRWEWKNNELADIRCPLSIYLCAERASQPRPRNGAMPKRVLHLELCGASVGHLCMFCYLLHIAAMQPTSLYNTVPRRAAKPISSQFESPAMSRREGEGETVEGTTINPAKLPICGGVPLCEKEEARALH